MSRDGPQGFSRDIVAMQEAIVSTLTAERDALRDALEDAMCLMPYARFDGLTLEEHAEKYPDGFPAHLFKKVQELRIANANAHVLSESAQQ